MPTEPSSGGGDDHATEASDDELTFAVHDLGRERAPEPAPRDLGFVPARPAALVSPPASPVATTVDGPHPADVPTPSADGFVIRDADRVAPAAPVDALVVGAPEPIAVAEPASPAAGRADAFQINSASAMRAPSPSALWTTRDPTPAAEVPTAPSRRGWSTRHSEVVDRSAHATMLRLREEAVNVSWKAAWLAVTSCNPGLLRKRAG